MNSGNYFQNFWSVNKKSCPLGFSINSIFEKYIKTAIFKYCNTLVAQGESVSPIIKTSKIF